MQSKIIAYLRVSTKKQGASGLGLEGQRAAVEAYGRQTGAQIIAEYVEVESGKLADRPELAKALAHVRRNKAVLIVAKLDRLARNVAFTSAIMRAGVDFICCDNPNANKLTIHILAAVAEDEAERISARTKAALAVARRKGIKLGSARPGHWKGREDRRLVGARNGAKASGAVSTKAATEAYQDLRPTVAELRERGLSLRAIAKELNEQGHTTRRGRVWNPVQVARLVDRFQSN
jgi:DNA invertase Pin-like site-specific DNA recombinase